MYNGDMNLELMVIIKGRVQGVFFRKSTKEKADSIGVTGWVKNQADGSVQACLQGMVVQMNAMLNWLHQGPDQAIVDDVQVISQKHCTNRSETFTILYE